MLQHQGYNFDFVAYDINPTSLEVEEKNTIKEFPQGYKFRLIAYNLENPSELVRIDNHCGKSLHYHSNGKQKFFTWVSLAETERLFLQLTQEKFGAFA